MSPPRKERAFFLFARHGHNLTGASPERSLLTRGLSPRVLLVTGCQARCDL